MPPTRKSKAKSLSKEAVLKSLSALSSDDREWVIRQQKCEEETIALRSRLPDVLQPFASNISICDPSKDQKVERLDGANDSCFDLTEAWVCLTVCPPTSRRSKPSEKYLTIQNEVWSTSSRYLSGSSCSEKCAIFLSYGAANEKSKKRGEAYAATYDDPGQDMYAHTEKGVQDVVRAVVKDMGYTPELDKNACMKVLDAFMGAPGAHILSHRVQDEASLRRVIRDGLEKKTGDYERI